MIEIKVNGELCSVSKRGKKREIAEDYLKAMLCVIEAFSGDIGAPWQDVLTLLYDQVIDIYNDGESSIKEV